jgi:hypothetical protein
MLSPDEIKHWKEQYKPIWEKWKKDKQDRGIPGEKILKRFWELTTQYGGK